MNIARNNDTIEYEILCRQVAISEQTDDFIGRLEKNATNIQPPEVQCIPAKTHFKIQLEKTNRPKNKQPLERKV